MFNQVRDRDEVGSMYPRENKSFMPYSEDSNKIEKYMEDAFIKCFSNSQYVSCVFVACTIN